MPWINHLPPVCWSTFGILVWNDSGYVNLTQWWYFFIIFEYILHISTPHIMVFCFPLPYFPLSTSALFFAKYSCTHIVYRRSLVTFYIHIDYRADSRSAPSQWETVLLCNNVSHWLGTSLESALDYTRRHGQLNWLAVKLQAAVIGVASWLWFMPHCRVKALNTFRPRQNGPYFANNIFKCIVMKWIYCIESGQTATFVQVVFHPVLCYVWSELFFCTVK